MPNGIDTELFLWYTVLMYFRTKTIKNTPLVQLVESYRNEAGQPRQRVVVSLGNVAIPEGEKKSIAAVVESQLRGEYDLFMPQLSKEGSELVHHIMQMAQKAKRLTPPKEATTLDGVITDKIETENVVQLGPQLVALKAWEELQMDKTLQSVGIKTLVANRLKLLITNRLTEPLSEHALIDWSHRTALPEITGEKLKHTQKGCLYRAGDILYKHRKKIEECLRRREKDLFNLKRSVVLYDVTNTHFEGQCASNPKAKHGKNKQNRNDCRQVALGIAYDEHGFALTHEIFAGNIADTKTLCTILKHLDVTEDTLKPVVILDAGFASEENIHMLEEKGYNYIINVTRGSRKKYKEYFDTERFTPLPRRAPEDVIEVKAIKDPENSRRKLVLCRSAQRRKKEEAIISKAEERFLADVGGLRTRIEKGRLKTSNTIERKIGRLKQKHNRVSRFYTIEHTKNTLLIQRKDAEIEEALSLCGDYVLKTNQGMDGDQLWYLYMTLLKAEKGFCLLKGTLGLRPNYHQLEERVETHMLISVMAYHLLTWINHKLKHHGDKREWLTIRRLLSTHCLVSTKLPLKDGRTITIRKPARPDADQLYIYTLLGIDWKKESPSYQTEYK